MQSWNEAAAEQQPTANVASASSFPRSTVCAWLDASDVDASLTSPRYANSSVDPGQASIPPPPPPPLRGKCPLTACTTSDDTFQDVVHAKHFADAVTARTWTAWMEGKCVISDCLDDLHLLTNHYVDDASKTLLRLPSRSMAAWGLREYLICKNNIVMLRKDTVLLRDQVAAALVNVDEQEEQRVKEFQKVLTDSCPEVFATETISELLAGRIVSQRIADRGQSVWRAALGENTALEFKTVLLDAAAQGFSTMLTAKKMELNHVAVCGNWPLRMYLRLQRHLNCGVETDGKLQIVLEREKDEVAGVYANFSDFEHRWFHAIVF